MTLSISTPLISTGTLTVSQFIAAVISQSNRTRYTDAEVKQIGERIRHWCGVFGFNHDIVFAQVIHETNYLKYTGDVPFGSHNFAGLGATGGVPGHRFPTIDAGTLATTAHHAVYRWGEKSKWPVHLQQYAGNHIDPRYSAVLSTGNAGKMFVLGDYRGTWAVPGRTYPESLIARSKQIAAFPGGDEVSAQIAGFKWQPADDRHHTRGRPVAIRGFAVHYTGRPSPNSSSLNWLTVHPNSNVSATFLIKHNPTMEDRGWQLVRIEDTPHTTAFANVYTVSFEYELMYGQSVPASAYPVMAQTIIDSTAYVRQRQLGSIPLDRAHIRPHREWVNNPALICSDGVMTDRIVTEIERLQGTGGPIVDFSKVPTEPDPWRDHLGGNPYGKSTWIPQVFVKNIRDNGGFVPVGFVTGGAFVDGPQLVQYFERGRLELNEDGTVTRGLVGLEALAVRSPDRLP